MYEHFRYNSEIQSDKKKKNKHNKEAMIQSQECFATAWYSSTVRYN